MRSPLTKFDFTAIWPLFRPNTVRSYKRAIGDLDEFMRKEALTKLSILTARSFLMALKETNLSHATRALKFEALRTIFEQLQGSGQVKVNPFAALRKIGRSGTPEQVRPGQVIKDRAVLKMLSLAKKHPTRAVEHGAILAALFGGGLRRSEALSVIMKDVDLKSSPPKLTLRSTKSGKIRTQSLAYWTRQPIQNYIGMRKRQGAGDLDKLFCRNKTPISESTLYRVFKHYAHAAGINASPHSVRTTAATKLILAQVPLQDVQRFMGHESIHTTLKYYYKAQELSSQAPQKLVFTASKKHL